MYAMKQQKIDIPFDGVRRKANSCEHNGTIDCILFRRLSKCSWQWPSCKFRARAVYRRIEYITYTFSLHEIYLFWKNQWKREKRRHNITFRITLNIYFYFYSRKCIVNNPCRLRGNSDLYRSWNYNYPELIDNSIVRTREKDLRVKTFAENNTCREKCKWVE